MSQQACLISFQIGTMSAAPVVLRRCEQSVLEGILWSLVDCADEHPDITHEDVVAANGYLAMLENHQLTMDTIFATKSGQLQALLVHGLVYPATLGYESPATSFRGPDERDFVQQLAVKLASSTGVNIPCSATFQSVVTKASESHHVDHTPALSYVNVGAGAGNSWQT